MSLAASPIRFPDVASRTVMTRRAWWLVVLNFLIPGSAQVLAGDRKLGRFGLGATLTLWFLAVVALVVWIFWPAVLYTVFSTDASRSGSSPRRSRSTPCSGWSSPSTRCGSCDS